MTLSAAPVYWLALVLQFFFFYQLRAFPGGGQLSITGSASDHHHAHRVA